MQLKALDRLGAASASPELMAKLASPDNRTRANAVMAMLRLGVHEAAETLLGMLEGENPNRSYRIAHCRGLIEQMKLLPLTSRILQMVEADGDPQVRDRARILVTSSQPPTSRIRPRRSTRRCRFDFAAGSTDRSCRLPARRPPAVLPAQSSSVVGDSAGSGTGGAGVVGIALITGVWQQRPMGRGEIAPLSLYRRVLLRMGLSFGRQVAVVAPVQERQDGPSDSLAALGGTVR